MQFLMTVVGFFVVSSLSSTGALARIQCSVSNEAEAVACVRKWANEKDEEGELPHTVGVTTLKKGKEAFERITGTKPKASYVAVVEVHYDEDKIYYLEISKGKDVSPILRRSTGNIEISDELGLTDTASDDLVAEYSLYIDNLEDFHL